MASIVRKDLERSNDLHKVEVRNRFKGLYLIDRVPDELWTEVRGIVQGSRPSPWKRNAKKAKWLSEEAL